jgi:hypothetical protein
MIEDIAEKQRQQLRDFMQRHNLKSYPWAKKAGISEGTIRNFLSGKSSSLTSSVIAKLAEAAGVSSVAIFADENVEIKQVEIIGSLEQDIAGNIFLEKIGISEFRPSPRYANKEFFALKADGNGQFADGSEMIFAKDYFAEDMKIGSTICAKKKGEMVVGEVIKIANDGINMRLKLSDGSYSERFIASKSMTMREGDISQDDGIIGLLVRTSRNEF